MVNWHSELDFDGAWIDMAEASSFCVGSRRSGNLTLNPVKSAILTSWRVFHAYPEGSSLTNGTEAAAASSASASQASAYPTAASASNTNYLRKIPTPGVRDINHPPYVINHVQGDLAIHAI